MLEVLGRIEEFQSAVGSETAAADVIPSRVSAAADVISVRVRSRCHPSGLTSSFTGPQPSPAVSDSDSYHKCHQHSQKPTSHDRENHLNQLTNVPLLRLETDSHLITIIVASQ